MNILSRLQDDPRKTWLEETSSNNEVLLIPPNDLWHEAGDEAAPENELPSGHDISADVDVFPKGKIEQTSQCWTFMGSVGGVGTTTLAVQMAYELAKLNRNASKKNRRRDDPQICLIDLDFENGSCRHFLDVEASLSIEDLTGDAIRIDTTLVQTLLSTHSSGISVLAAPNVLGANARVKPEIVLALLDAACEMFPYVILDLPRNWQGWSQAAIAGSDFVGLLSDLTIPSLHMARTKRNHLIEMLDDEVACQIILNKYERRSFNNRLRVSDARIALQCEIFGTICMEQNITREALNCGEPVGTIRGDSRYAKDSRKLLQQIIEVTKVNTPNEVQTAHVAA